MILVHYTTELCELGFQNFNSLLEKKQTILVIMTPARVGKQLLYIGKFWQGKTLANLAICYEFTKVLSANCL